MDEDDDDLMTGQDENDYSAVATPAAVNPDDLAPAQPIDDLPERPIKK